MKRVGLLLGKLALCLSVLILLLSVVLNISPLSFFAEIHKYPGVNIFYLVVLYVMIFVIVNRQLINDKQEGIRELFMVKNRKTLPRILILTVLTAFLFSLYVLFLLETGRISIIADPQRLMIIMAKGGFFGFLFSLVEEILFRGYIFQAIRRDEGPWTAYLFSCFLFAVVHILRSGAPGFKIFYFAGLFLLGVLLCYALEKAENLTPSVLVHTVLIACMYIFSEGFAINRHIYLKSDFLWGMEYTPAAGIWGISIFLILILAVKILFNPALKVKNAGLGQPSRIT